MALQDWLWTSGGQTKAWPDKVVDLAHRAWTHTIKASSSPVSSQTAGFSLALGMVVHGLSASGHGKAEDIQPHLLASWMKILLTEVGGLEPEREESCL